MASSSHKSATKANLVGKRQPEDGLETKSILKRHKEISEEEHIEGSVELSKDRVERLDEPPVQKKTVFVDSLPPETEISDIIDFFQDVGQVVRVRLILDDWGEHVGCGFVEFATAIQAKKALEMNQSEIFIDVANKGTRCLPPKYYIDHKVWYQEDYLQQQEKLAIEKPPNSVKEAAVLFVANLSPQTTKISHIVDFFQDVGDVVSVRLIVNDEGKHVGYGFVEFPSAHQAKWALENKNGEYLHDHKILLMKRHDETPNLAEAVAIRNKTLFIAKLSPLKTKISHIINFFKDVGQVVHVRLIVDQRCRLTGFGYVEFASVHEAEKALEKKKGKYLHNRDIYLRFAKTDADTSETKYCIDHKVWYEEDYLQHRENETPDFVEDVALRENAVFVADLSMKKEALCNILDIINFFGNVGEVIRVQLVVDGWGEHVGCCFAEFACANEAKKAVQKKSGNNFFVNVAKMDHPYPFQPIRYKLAEKLWYEDNLRRPFPTYTVQTCREALVRRQPSTR